MYANFCQVYEVENDITFGGKCLKKMWIRKTN